MKKFLLSTLAGLVFFLSFVPNLLTAKAATTTPSWYNSSFSDWYGKVYDPNNPSEIFGERYTAAQVQWVVYGLFSFLINTATGPQNSAIIQCFLNNVADITTCTSQLSKLVGPINNSAIAQQPPKETNVWSLVFATDRPLSGIGYVKGSLENFSLIPTAHAQTVGFGFNALSPIQNLWRAFRDIAFGLFVIVAVVFAFMIMFRVKISPQVVITVQSAIPKMVLSLILVTFSYAIAGFLVDFMYIVIGIFSVIGSQLITVGVPSVNVGLSPSAWFNFLTLGQPLGLNIQVGVLGLLAIYFVSFFLSLVILLVINAGALGTLLAGAITIGLIASGAGSVLLILVLLVAIIAVIIMFWVAIKVVWGLLKAFVNVLLLTIFAPLQLALGTVVPSMGFGPWLKSYISALSTFVVTGLLILLSYIFLAQGVQIGLVSMLPADGNFGEAIVRLLLGGGASGLTQTITGNQNAWPPLLGVGGGSATGLLLVAASFVLFTMIPKASDIIKAMIEGKPFAYGTSIGELTGPAGTMYGGYAGAQLAGGNLPAPLNRESLNKLYRRIFTTEEARRSLGRQIEEAARQPRR